MAREEAALVPPAAQAQRAQRSPRPDTQQAAPLRLPMRYAIASAIRNFHWELDHTCMYRGADCHKLLQSSLVSRGRTEG